MNAVHGSSMVTALHVACMTPFRRHVRWRRCPRPRRGDIKPRHALHICQALLDAGADVHAVDDQGYTPLHYAAEAGWGDVIRLLLQRGARLAPAAKGWTPLHVACRRQRPEAVRLLLQRDSDQVHLEEAVACLPHRPLNRSIQVLQACATVRPELLERGDLLVWLCRKRHEKLALWALSKTCIMDDDAGPILTACLPFILQRTNAYDTATKFFSKLFSVSLQLSPQEAASILRALLFRLLRAEQAGAVGRQLAEDVWLTVKYFKVLQTHIGASHVRLLLQLRDTRVLCHWLSDCSSPPHAYVCLMKEAVRHSKDVCVYLVMDNYRPLTAPHNWAQLLSEGLYRRRGDTLQDSTLCLLASRVDWGEESLQFRKQVLRLACEHAMPKLLRTCLERFWVVMSPDESLLHTCLQQTVDTKLLECVQVLIQYPMCTVAGVSSARFAHDTLGMQRNLLTLLNWLLQYADIRNLRLWISVESMALQVIQHPEFHLDESLKRKAYPSDWMSGLVQLSSMRIIHAVQARFPEYVRRMINKLTHPTLLDAVARNTRCAVFQRDAMSWLLRHPNVQWTREQLTDTLRVYVYSICERETGCASHGGDLYLDVLRPLLEAGADVNVSALDGMPSLVLAQLVERKMTDALQLCLQFGARLTKLHYVHAYEARACLPGLNHLCTQPWSRVQWRRIALFYDDYSVLFHPDVQLAQQCVNPWFETIPRGYEALVTSYL